MLRPATAADLEPLVALARHPEVAATLSTTAAEGVAAALAADAGELLAIERDGTLVGGVRWELVNRRSRIGSPSALATSAIRSACSRWTSG